MSKLCVDCKIKQAAKSRKICLACKNIRWKLKYPFEYAYNNLKHNAKKRKKLFTLSFEKFKQLAIETNYMNKKGIYKHSLHIDRIIETDGYTDNNVQVLENHINVKKYVEFRYGASENSNFTTITYKINNDDNDDCPF